MWRRTIILLAKPPAEVYGSFFTVSPRCWDRIATKNVQDGQPNSKRYLRLAIESGGCHGFIYKFEFIDAKSVDADEDIVCQESEFNPEGPARRGGGEAAVFVIDEATAKLLKNAVIDFHTELKGSAFVVVGNELVDQSCACALSFSVKKAQ